MKEEYVIRIRPRRALRRLAISAAVLSVFAAVFYVSRATILGALGREMVSTDRLEKADVMLVLAGGTPERELAAADLYREGIAPQILLTREPEGTARTAVRARGVPLPDAIEARMQIMQALGVPRTALLPLPGVVESTFGEAEEVRLWLTRHPAKSLLIVTSPFHTARARFIFDRRLKDTGVQVRMSAASIQPFDPALWWTSRTNLRDGLFELQKTLFYRVRYCCS